MKRQSGFKIMMRLLKELKPLVGVMMITITLGVLGFLTAISIASFAAVALGTLVEGATIVSFKAAITIMAVCAVMRGLLRYGEQLSGHYIAFKILYLLRDKIFAKLRTLAPAKLEGRDKGDLISLITSDIELLEVFYAHTIAPIAIAILTNSMITALLWFIHPIYGVLAAFFFILVGFVVPYASSKLVSEAGVNYRREFGSSNQYILDSLRGLKEILLFNQGQERLTQLNQKSGELNESIRKIKDHEGIVTGITSTIITLAMLVFLGVGAYLYSIGAVTLTLVLVALVVIASSFGPVVALSNLSNTLAHTFACAERLFELLDEMPQVEEVSGQMPLTMNEMTLDRVSFAYPNSDHLLLDEASIHIEKGEKLALIGESGIGKSTFIKLLMRYFDTKKGHVFIDGTNIKSIPTASLRLKQTLVSQETYLFNDTIENNIKIGCKDASLEEVIEAAKKASIHEFIESLPKGYQTKVGELGGMVSSGEKQRLGLARAFLHNGDVLILDEPTSNLDALNEGSILKSIQDYGQDKTVILISHRKSTTAICEKVYRLENQKLYQN
ncbi:thiol reductant ABC exporter subunit CydC [Turicibacter sanguinis]|uniref:Thiol reductant ABC exporter subunit CydC n=4 Tax=Turicibacter sanguinis TaxID=154288 RepID=A0A9X4XDU6_9FIRM|nr:thiol reductant ABC exporter subunit CydC [Turicibacter sanguinis]EFF64916.1 ABC transporter, ATP-binding protein [Turicibacter sanguinis PC909]MDB8459373.1 thiol reductant ABC exporter subunit CydC [Turicibacter sanguinis]MDB8542969.1 thiol reductant ABC exporter subunit CydC [Turicibacter sanguinis]MDB8573712.1 thiol reductant ABC exporter subunit CydC [Turicibacter sanguinis]MDB8577195.1 thiol reductant ABC exporter subunit CydC [Turicibacter sanguinis]